MLQVSLRTDKPEAEIGVYIDGIRKSYHVWEAHRSLAETIHTTLRDELAKQDHAIRDVQGFIVYKGPGSFTGLRIGAATANALADGLSAKIVGETGDDWVQKGLERLASGQSDGVVLPEYGAAPNITQPRK